MNCFPAAIFFSSVSAAITFPRASRPLLIEIPSYIYLPEAPVFFILSEPARSTKWNFAEIFSSDIWTSSLAFSACYSTTLTIFWSIVIVKMACERDEPSFIMVELVTRSAIPLLSKAMHSCLDVTNSLLRPSTLIVPFFSSLIWTVFVYCPVTLSTVPISRRSWISSPYSSRN